MQNCGKLKEAINKVIGSAFVGEEAHLNITFTTITVEAKHWKQLSRQVGEKCLPAGKLLSIPIFLISIEIEVDVFNVCPQKQFASTDCLFKRTKKRQKDVVGFVCTRPTGFLQTINQIDFDGVKAHKWCDVWNVGEEWKKRPLRLITWPKA